MNHPLIVLLICGLVTIIAYSLRIKPGDPRYVRHEKREGWTRYLAIYQYICPDCGKITEDYNHGRPDKLRLNCQHCGETHRFGYSRQIRPDLARLPRGRR